MKEKNVLITGASRGIGRETARIFAQNGYTLFLTCQNRIDLLRETAGELNDLFSVPCFPFVGDMGDESFVTDLFSEIRTRCGHLDVLINNAGISHIGLLQDMSLAQWNQMLSTDLTSVFLTCRAAIPLMLSRHQGSIVNAVSYTHLR